MKKSPLGDRKVQNGAGRGHAANSTMQALSENLVSPGQGNPAASKVDLGMNQGGKGTAGRKTFPKVGM